MAITTDHFERALAAILDACDTEQDMTDWTTRLITTASVMSGHQVLRGRGWEQAKLADLVQSAGGFVDDEYFRQDDPRE